MVQFLLLLMFYLRELTLYIMWDYDHVQFLLLLMFYLRELTLYIMWDYDHGTIPPSLNVLFKRTNTVHNVGL